jgi:hypothetical protein
MPDTLQGFPFWPLEFGNDGTPTDPGAIDRLVTEAKAAGLSDLYIFSHGWNNDFTTARTLYDGFFAQVAKLLANSSFPTKRAAKIGVTGVLWPSILWPDDAPDGGDAPEVPPVSGGGSVAMPATGAAQSKPIASPAAINAVLKSAYADSQHELIDALTALLEQEPQTDAALKEFQGKLAQLLGTETTIASIDPKHPDAAEAAIVTLEYTRWRKLLEQLGNAAQARHAAPTSGGGAAGLGNPFKKLWAGAKDALRIATYWQMKQRAGVVGRTGLAPVLARLGKESPATRVHLMGHSFGARLVSFSLTGLPSTMTGAASPVKSLFLMQGAFSHFAFADALPFDTSRSGALKGMAARVDGPLLATFTKRDYAVGITYPAASFVNGDDSSSFDAQASRWGGMGSDGAQAVKAAAHLLSAPGTSYAFSKGAWLNLDGNQVIKHGWLPAGAHSDILHPETAWAALAAAGIV